MQASLIQIFKYICVGVALKHKVYVQMGHHQECLCVHVRAAKSDSKQLLYVLYDNDGAIFTAFEELWRNFLQVHG
jgi:hypothetical protein